ncbi:hypothetical protein Y1Q_0012616 [Alligator mississippiensis]|uniref:Uncharacterized protein n=1 Tax=Alligator mississippiensis TaxID=8496 RepID=A0A151M8B4_ALLMI|nr:hypothetical protein Y1Q_0012616 [Alligator mississippiensis]
MELQSWENDVRPRISGILIQHCLGSTLQSWTSTSLFQSPQLLISPLVLPTTNLPASLPADSQLPFRTCPCYPGALWKRLSLYCQDWFQPPQLPRLWTSKKTAISAPAEEIRKKGCCWNFACYPIGGADRRPLNRLHDPGTILFKAMLARNWIGR